MKSISRAFKKQQHLIVPAVSLVVSLVAFLFGVIPFIQKTLELRTRSVDLRGEIAKLREKQAALDAMDEETLRTQLTSLLTAVPSETSLPLLFATLDNLSAQTGITVSDMTIQSPGAIVASGSAQKQTLLEREIGSNLLPFSVTIDGTLPQMKSFLETAIAVRRFFRVRDFTLGFTSGTVGKVRVTMDAFYAPLPTTIGAASQPLVPLTQTEEELLSRVGSLPLLGGALVGQDLPPPDEGGTGKENPFE